jgi:hypothetical protein
MPTSKKGCPSGKPTEKKKEAGREEVATRLEAIHNKAEANQMRLEPETEHQEKMDVNLKEVEEDIKSSRDIQAETKVMRNKRMEETKACQDTKANL